VYNQEVSANLTRLYVHKVAIFRFSTRGISLVSVLTKQRNTLLFDTVGMKIGLKAVFHFARIVP
jgi:hypothetical protein